MVGMAWNLVHGDDAFLYLIRLSPLVLMFCDDDGLGVGLLLERDGLFRGEGRPWFCYQTRNHTIWLSDDVKCSIRTSSLQ